jgi:hypothetical protein
MPTSPGRHLIAEQMCKILLGKGISRETSERGEREDVSCRVVVHQHGSPRATRLGSEGPPADEECGAQGQKQVHSPGLGSKAKGQHSPDDQRNQSQYQGDHRSVRLLG